MYTARVNYDNAWEIVIDPARQGFTHMPINGVLADFLNLDPLQSLYFDPINMMNVKNNRIIASYLNTSTSFPKYRISGFNDKTIPQLEDLLKAQEERVKQDEQTIQENQELKNNLKRAREADPNILVIADQVRKFSKYLPNSMFSQYSMDMGWNPFKIPPLPAITNNITNIMPGGGTETTEADGQEQVPGDGVVVGQTNAEVPQIANAGNEQVDDDDNLLENNEEEEVDDEEEEEEIPIRGRKNGPSGDTINRLDVKIKNDPALKEKIRSEIVGYFNDAKEEYENDPDSYKDSFRGEGAWIREGNVEAWAAMNIALQDSIVNEYLGKNTGLAVGFDVYPLGLWNGTKSILKKYSPNKLNSIDENDDDEDEEDEDDEEEEEKKADSNDYVSMTPAPKSEYQRKIEGLNDQKNKYLTEKQTPVVKEAINKIDAQILQLQNLEKKANTPIKTPVQETKSPEKIPTTSPYKTPTKNIPKNVGKPSTTNPGYMELNTINEALLYFDDYRYAMKAKAEKIFYENNDKSTKFNEEAARVFFKVNEDAKLELARQMKSNAPAPKWYINPSSGNTFTAANLFKK